MLQEAEMENSYADLTADARKIIKDDNNIIISMKEEKKTVEYQGTIKLYAKNISKINKYGNQYMKLLMHHFLKKLIFSTIFFRLM